MKINLHIKKKKKLKPRSIMLKGKRRDAKRNRDTMNELDTIILERQRSAPLKRKMKRIRKKYLQAQKGGRLRSWILFFQFLWTYFYMFHYQMISFLGFYLYIWQMNWIFNHFLHSQIYLFLLGWGICLEQWLPFNINLALKL